VHPEVTSRKFSAHMALAPSHSPPIISRRRVAVDAPEPLAISFPDGGKTKI
jgi:hypothetical protein